MPEPDAELIEQVKRNDIKAFERLYYLAYVRDGPRIRELVRHIILNGPTPPNQVDSVVEDIFYDVLTVLWTARYRLRLQPGQTVTPYLLETARYTAWKVNRERWRQNRNIQRYIEQANPPRNTPGGVAGEQEQEQEQLEMTDKVWNYVIRQGDKQKFLNFVELYRRTGWGYERLAKSLCIPRSTAYSWFFKLKKLVVEAYVFVLLKSILTQCELY